MSLPSQTPSSTMSITPPLPPAKVSLLLSNFILSTSTFLNTFATAADVKLQSIGKKITDIEIMMTILEAKLKSVPDEDYEQKVEQETVKGTTGEDGAKTDETDASPPPTEGVAATSTVTETAIVANPNECKACEHPDYAPFFRQVKIGAPLPAVQAKVAAAGLDPEFLARDPEEMVPFEGGGEE